MRNPSTPKHPTKIVAGVISSILFLHGNVSAQTVASGFPRPALYFLTLAPDARSAGMGDAGVAVSPDANATYWNAAKLAFADRDFGASVSYAPWLRNLTDDMWLGYASVYKRIGKGQAIAISANHYHGGVNPLFTASGISLGNFRSSESAIAGTYATQLGRDFSMGLTLKYITSNVANGAVINAVTLKPGQSIAGDISVYYKKELINSRDGKNMRVAFGAVISNMGGAMSYGMGTDQTYLPTTFKLGAGLSFTPVAKHQFNFILDASKLALPTPVNGVIPSNQPVINAVFKSFNDAPGGFKEEMQEVVWSGGVEYKYNYIFAVRGGYFGEHRNKGNRKYFTAGAGLRFLKNYNVDFAYMFPVKEHSPFANTFRVSVSANLNTRARYKD